MLSAFPTEGELRRLLDDEFSVPLDKITTAPNLEDKMNAVLTAFQTEGRLGALVGAAYRTKPGNPQLAACMKKGFDSNLLPEAAAGGGGKWGGRLVPWRRVARDWRTWAVVAAVGLLTLGGGFWGGWKARPAPPVVPGPLCRPNLTAIYPVGHRPVKGLTDDDVNAVSKIEGDGARAFALVLTPVAGANNHFKTLLLKPNLKFEMKYWKVVVRDSDGLAKGSVTESPNGAGNIQLSDVSLDEGDYVVVLVGFPKPDEVLDWLFNQNAQRGLFSVEVSE
jgi:hypothetical protein